MGLTMIALVVTAALELLVAALLWKSRPARRCRRPRRRAVKVPLRAPSGALAAACAKAYQSPDAWKKFRGHGTLEPREGKLLMLDSARTVQAVRRLG